MTAKQIKVGKVSNKSEKKIITSEQDRKILGQQLI